MGATLTINGALVRADASGALSWPEAGMLIVADLHLEKGSSFVRAGRFLPPYDTRETIDRLTAVVRRFQPRRVVCLGDTFHDASAASRLPDVEAARLRDLAGAHDWIWVAGNHDPAPPERFGGRVVTDLAEGPFCFRHEPSDGRLFPGDICGHFHPKATVSSRGHRITGRCFVTDGVRMILPAFGAYTGGLDVLDPAVAGLFGRTNFRVLLAVRERLFMFSRTQIDRTATQIAVAK